MSLSLILSAVSVIFCMVFFIYIKWYVRRRTSMSEIFEERRIEVSRLLAEIDAITDRDAMLVEERMKKLREILEDADKRIKVYVQELERSKSSEALYTSLGKGIRAALKTEDEISVRNEPAPQMDRRSFYPQNAPNLTVVRPGKDSSPSLPLLSPEPPPAQNKSPSRHQLRAQIEDMINDGLSRSEIASQLDISLSEVELAVNLMGRRR